MKLALPILTALLLAPLVALHAAELKLSAIFSDHMVLQRKLAVPIWGAATPGEEITVEFAGQKKTATADGIGKWLVRLDPLSASAEPRTLKANGMVITDVLVGDVWLCSGQSNMGVSVRGSANPEQEIAAAQYPSIRLFNVASNPAAHARRYGERGVEAVLAADRGRLLRRGLFLRSRTASRTQDPRRPGG